MQEAEMVAMVIAIVGMLRIASPRINGLIVPIVAVVVGMLVSMAHMADIPETSTGWLGFFRTGVRIGLTAVGGMHAILYGSKKLGDAARGADTGPA